MKLNTGSLVLALVLSSVSLSAVAGSTMTSSSTATTASQSGLTAAQKADGQIIEMLMVINTNEINASNEALKRTSDSAVKTFAQSMVTAHNENLQDFQNLSKQINIAPIDTSKSEYMQSRGQKELKTLSSVSASKFDMTYANAMVKGHQSALNVIDNKLLPQAANANLKALLTSTRAVVVHHLQMAQVLQSQLSQ